eukprot:jgi/Picsp_1/135/NSC_00134-R1_protein
MIKFVLLVNKQGQTRLSKYTDSANDEEGPLDRARSRLYNEAEIVRKCLKRSDKETNYIEHQGTRVVYRRYASLFFMVGVDENENELAILEFIHCLVETMDRWFGNVCELDIMFSLDAAHAIIDEMLYNGIIMDVNKSSVLAPLRLLEKAA